MPQVCVTHKVRDTTYSVTHDVIDDLGSVTHEVIDDLESVTREVRDASGRAIQEVEEDRWSVTHNVRESTGSVMHNIRDTMGMCYTWSQRWWDRSSKSQGLQLAFLLFNSKFVLNYAVYQHQKFEFSGVLLLAFFAGIFSKQLDHRQQYYTFKKFLFHILTHALKV